MTKNLCSVCTEAHYAKGYCKTHYQRWKKHGDPLKILKDWSRQEGECSVDDCTTSQFKRGFCSKHYTRWYAHGDPLTVLKVAKSPEGRRKNAQGYVVLRGYKDHPNSHPNGTILEHVLVMSSKLGRSLMQHENVHHINGDREDNRPENLELWSTWQPAGQRVEDKVAWAIEILKQYIPEVLSPTKE